MEFRTLALALLLIFVIQDDLRHFRIRNAVVSALMVLFVVDCVARGEFSRLGTHAAFAAIMACAALAAFHLQFIGGGDAKLLIAAEFWLGLEQSSVFALLLLTSTLAYSVCAKIGLLPARQRDGRTLIPFGPCIAVAWFGTLVLLNSL